MYILHNFVRPLNEENKYVINVKPASYNKLDE